MDTRWVLKKGKVCNFIIVICKYALRLTIILLFNKGVTHLNSVFKLFVISTKTI